MRDEIDVHFEMAVSRVFSLVMISMVYVNFSFFIIAMEFEISDLAIFSGLSTLAFFVAGITMFTRHLARKERGWARAVWSLVVDLPEPYSERGEEV